MGSEGGVLIFTYGTLKRGFSNHVLLRDMVSTGHATFLGCYRTRQRLPLVCGPYRVPFLLNLPARGRHVQGELYAVSPTALNKMDELEGVTKGHYERLPIELIKSRRDDCDDDDVDGIKGSYYDDDFRGVVCAEAYYGHRSYAEAMWERSGCEGYECYTEKVAKGYVRRNERPQNMTFLDHIRVFLDSSANSAQLSC